MRFYFLILAALVNSSQTFSQEIKSDSLLNIEHSPYQERAEYLRKKGNEKIMQGKYDEALPILSNALKEFEAIADSVGIASCFNSLAMANERLGNDQEAVELYYQSIDINKSLNLKAKLAGNYVNLGSYYSSRNDLNLAYKYYSASSQLFETIGNPIRLANSYFGLGNILSKQDFEGHSFDSAYYYFSKVITIACSEQNTILKYRCYNSLGFLYKHKNNPDSAIFYYLKSHELTKKLNNREGQIFTNLNIGNSYKNQGNYGIALNYFNDGLKFAREFKNNVRRLDLLANIITCKIKLDDFEEADLLFAEYYTLNDSIYNQEKTKQLKELEAIYESEKIGKELIAQTRITQVQTRLNYWLIALIIGVVIISAIALLFFIQRQRFQKKIRDQQVARLKKEQELIELNAMMHGQEEERNRIAEDLHDRLGARLSAIKLLSEQQKDKNGKQLTAMLEASINETRKISHNLSTDMLTRFGLENAVKDLVLSVNLSDSLDGDFTSTNINERLPAAVEKPVYHIISELINNTIKHAKATSFFIQLTQEHNLLNLLYEDDGVGFDLESETNNGMGMKNLKARVEGMRGEINIDTLPGNGMQVLMHVPLT